MSNPVAPPPPPNQGGYVPPANQGFGTAPSGQPTPPGQPFPGQPQPGQPQQGFGDAPTPFSPPPAAKKGGGARNIILRIVGVVVVLVILAVVRSVFFGDKAKDAAVGDCVAASKSVKADEETDAQAKVVDCGSKDAAYTVVGRVNGESDVNSKSCDTYFTKETGQYFVYASSNNGTEYLLCLEAK